MRKIFTLLMLALALGACSLEDMDSQSPDFDVKVETEGDGSILGTVTNLYIISKENEVTINEVIVNRGVCKADTSHLPVKLKFGVKLRVRVWCDPLEVVIKSSGGTSTYEFKSQ